MSQNTSTAVMQRRLKNAPPRPDASKDSLDFYPAPAWATRALCEWIATTRRHEGLNDLGVWEPACGEHHMVRPLREYFGSVRATDVAVHNGGHEIEDFIFPFQQYYQSDWIITNPPFSLAQEFATIAIQRASRGVALLTRIAFLEGIGRFYGLYEKCPPTDILQFAERVPMTKNRLDREASSATAVAWLVWRKRMIGRPSHFHWIPPCRKRLERDEDYPSESP